MKPSRDFSVLIGAAELSHSAWIWLVSSLFLVIILQQSSRAQQRPARLSLNQIPAYGFLLKDGWRFHAGDVPDGASPQLDDSRWDTLNPVRDVRDLTPLQRAGLGWFRLHIRTGPDLPPLLVKLYQSVASDIYLDGQLLYHFGTVSADPGRVVAYNPSAAYNLPLRPSSDHVLALRVACQPGVLYTNKALHWDAPALEYWVFSATELPAFKPIATQEMVLSAFKTGIAFILFVLHLSLFVAYRTQRANLYAAGMYLMLCLTFLARSFSEQTHLLGTRIFIHYASFIDAWVPCVALLTCYSLFNFRKGWLCWLAIGSILFVFLPLPPGLQWLSLAGYLLQFDLLRLAVVAARRRLLGANIILAGAFVGLSIWLLRFIMEAVSLSPDGHEWLFNTFYLASFLCFPLTLSLWLALEHGWINRQLKDRLHDVEHLSARNQAQQQERQQLLAQQNEQLEQQVAERTHELKQQANRLRQLDETKSRFVTNITHEFRTPLSLILSPVEKLLQQGRFDRHLLTLVHRNAGQLLRLINQLLDLSKLENNHMAVSLVQGNVTEFTQPILATFRRAAEQKGVTLTCTSGPFPSHSHLFDADKWEKIVTNLLANALKFTPPGGQVTLCQTPVLKADRLTGVQYRLTDTGIGIVPAQLPHIFDRFYQADTSSTRTYGGTGIGLALVRELVDLLGGTITVASEPGRGTTFLLTLPVQPVSAESHVPVLDGPGHSADELYVPTTDRPASPIRPDEAGTLRVLIVDDNDELREFLVSELDPAYHVLQAADGRQGWSLIQAELPDIVLTDIMMPHLDGRELTQLIKSNAATDHIAVVMLTAKANQQSRIEGLQHGADDYLSKPFNVDELRLRLQNMATRQHRLQERLRTQLMQPLPAGSPLGTGPEHIFLQRTYAILNEHLASRALGVEELAQHLHLNRTSLHRKLKNLTGLSPNELIRAYRLKRATELLSRGVSSSETAYQTGFDSPAYFTKCFRDQYGMTPTDFARKASESEV